MESVYTKFSYLINNLVLDPNRKIILSNGDIFEALEKEEYFDVHWKFIQEPQKIKIIWKVKVSNGQELYREWVFNDNTNQRAMGVQVTMGMDSEFKKLQ